METVTIRSIFRDQVNTKRGPGTRVSIYTEEHPDVRMTSFDARTTKDWKGGDKVQIEIQKNGNFTNFRTSPGRPKQDNSDIERRLSKLEAAVFGTTDTPPAPVYDTDYEKNVEDAF